MYHEVRRKDRLMDNVESMAVLQKGEYGIMSSVGKDGQPYGNPLSYIVADDAIYFHCAKTGHKIENIKHDSRVSFNVVGKTQPVFDKNFTTYYESITVFGKAQEVLEENLKKEMLMEICEKYLPEHMEKAEEAIEKSMQRTAVYKISIDHMTGKEKKPV